MPCPSSAGRLGVCLVLLHVPAGAMRGQSESADRRHQEDESAPHPALCDPAIVRETCVLLGSPDPDGNATQEGVREALSASTRSVEGLWRQLGLADPAPCALLCSALIRHAGEAGVLPPSSDVACYSVGTEVLCDLDVGPRIVSNFSSSSDMPDFHDREVMKEAEEEVVDHTRRLRQGSSAAEIHNDTDADPNVTEIDYGAWEVVERTAEMFRIYPARADDFGADGAMPRLNSWYTRDDDPTKRAIQLGKKAMAYMNIAAQKVRIKQTRPYMKKWFGSQDAQPKVLSVINSVISILNGVQYVYPGQKCRTSTYAYVFPDGERCWLDPAFQPDSFCKVNARGQHVVYLCPYYFKVTDLERIETLVHEASHHEVARTDDVCVSNCGGNRQNKVIAYGRQTCMSLAKSSTNRALKNADSYCYYISDVMGSNACPAHARFRTPNVHGDCECRWPGSCWSSSSAQGCYSSRSTWDSTYFHPLCETCHCGIRHNRPQPQRPTLFSGAAGFSPHLLVLWLGVYFLLEQWGQGLRCG